MATSPGYVRLANSATRPLTDDIFDALREAVIVVDARSAQLPLILANAAARRCFLGEFKAISLVESSLYSLLGPATQSAIAAALGTLTSVKASVNRVLTWRFPRGEIPLLTELKMLETAPGHPSVMLTFSEPSSEPLTEPGILSAIEHLPLDPLILDKALTATYANAGAARTAGGTVEDVLSLSALILI